MSKLRAISGSWTGRLNIFKMPILLNLINSSTQSQLKPQQTILCVPTQWSESPSAERNDPGEPGHIGGEPSRKTDTSSRQHGLWTCRNRESDVGDESGQLEQRKRIKTPEGKPHRRNQLAFGKVAKTTNMGENSVFNKWHWNNEKST